MRLNLAAMYKWQICVMLERNSAAISVKYITVLRTSMYSKIVFTLNSEILGVSHRVEMFLC